MHLRAFGTLLGLSLLVVACGPAPNGGPAADEGAAPASSGPSKTLVIVTRGAMSNLGGQLRAGTSTLPKLFNAGLAIKDGQGQARPHLAEALPQLNGDDWKVLPDGKMETIYRLKKGLVWQDGAPFSADDVVFGWQVLGSKDLGSAGAVPQTYIERAEAVDPNTVLIRWRAPYPLAGQLGQDFYPKPRHILGPHFDNVQIDAWNNLPFWSQEYVGMGAYRVDLVEPGSFTEAVAFDRYVFGKPKIDRVRVVTIPDPNTIVANMLAETTHLVEGVTIRSPQGNVLAEQWASRGSGAGSVYYTPAQTRYAVFQYRPDYAKPLSLLDKNVRKAIVSSLDKEGLATALLGERGQRADVFVPPSSRDFAAASSAVTKYPLDPRRTQQFFEEAGFARGADGFFAKPGEAPFQPQLAATAGNDSALEVGILADASRRAGINFQEYMVPQPGTADSRVLFPGVLLWSTTGEPDDWLGVFISGLIPSQDNRFAGNNRGGWSHADYDRLVDRFGATLDPADRGRLRVELSKFLSDEVPVMPMFYNLDIVAHVAGLKNLEVAPNAEVAWNVETWTLS